MAKKIPIGSKKHPLVQVMQEIFPGFSDEQILDTFRGRLTEREYKRLFGPDMEQREREYDKNRPSLCDMTQFSRQYVLAITIEKCPVRVYRQLEVPSNIRLEHLARIIIGIIGWFGGHLGTKHSHTGNK